MSNCIKQIFRNLKNYNSVIFLDRDGTINRDVGYPHSVEQIEILPTVAEGISKLNKKNIAVIVVTNQPMVAYDYANVSKVKMINQNIVTQLAAKDAYIDAIYSCPHHPKGSNRKYGISCLCRKPSLGMFRQSQKDYPLAKIIGIMGDSPRDIEFGKKLKINYVLLETNSFDTNSDVLPNRIVENFLQGINTLLEKQ